MGNVVYRNKRNGLLLKIRNIYGDKDAYLMQEVLGSKEDLVYMTAETLNENYEKHVVKKDD